MKRYLLAGTFCLGIILGIGTLCSNIKADLKTENATIESEIWYSNLTDIQPISVDVADEEDPEDEPEIVEFSNIPQTGPHRNAGVTFELDSPCQISTEIYSKVLKNNSPFKLNIYLDGHPLQNLQISEDFIILKWLEAGSHTFTFDMQSENNLKMDDVSEDNKIMIKVTKKYEQDRTEDKLGQDINSAIPLEEDDESYGVLTERNPKQYFSYKLNRESDLKLKVTMNTDSNPTCNLSLLNEKMQELETKEINASDKEYILSKDKLPAGIYYLLVASTNQGYGNITVFTELTEQPIKINKCSIIAKKNTKKIKINTIGQADVKIKYNGKVYKKKSNKSGKVVISVKKKLKKGKKLSIQVTKKGCIKLVKTVKVK